MLVPLPSGRLFSLARALDDLLSNDAVGADEIAVFVALARHVDENGECFPSQGTLAKLLRRSRPWVNARIARLNELKILEKRRHRLAKGGETSCRYHLPSLDMARTLPKPSTTVERGRIRPGDTPRQADVTPCHDADTNRDSHQPLTHQPTEPTQPATVVPLEVEQLARHLQRASAGPWRLENARKAVASAIERFGLAAVQDLVRKMQGAGLKPWEITSQLDRLEHSSGSTDAATAPDRDNTVLSNPVVRMAVKLMRDASPDKRLIWHRAACDAGYTAPGFMPEHWVPYIAAAFLQTEHRRDWDRLQA